MLPKPAAPTQSSPALAAIVGADPSLGTVLARASLVAPTRTPVLVTGESGTGKELLARVLHELGPTPDGPYVVVNCGALSRELAESELFGHERGAFTGASARRAGWFEEASGGTLVLDEIGELPADLQPKLLRVLETGRLRRVGGNGEIPVPVRLVTMTLRELRREVQMGRFRLDLYHRLAGFELTLPPLRRRLDDLAPLVCHFLAELESEMGPRTISDEALDRLRRHDWPGNVRELRNVVRRAALMSPERIDCAAIELDGPAYATPCELRLATHAAESAAPVASVARPEIADTLWLPSKSYLHMEKEIYVWALRRYGSRRRAAKTLGISRSTFCDRINRLGITG